MKVLVAAVQMPSELLQIAANLERADSALGEASQAGSALAVLPEMFITGHGLLSDFGPAAEGIDGPTLRHLSGRSRQWRMGIAAGFVERTHGHLYDALALFLGLRLTQQINDRFAGRSSICDGRRAPPVIAGIGAQLVLSEVTVHNPTGAHSWRSTFPSVRAASFSGSA